MERYVIDRSSGSIFNAKTDDDKRAYVKNASKYLFIYPDRYEIILIDFQTDHYNNVYDERFINEINELMVTARVVLGDKKKDLLAIVLSDTHLNIVQFLFPFMFAEYVTKVNKWYELSLRKLDKNDIDIIHLGDYGLSQFSRIFKEKREMFKGFNLLILKILKQLNVYGIYLAGNHDFFINRSLGLMIYHINVYGGRAYLFIHGPPLTLDMPDKEAKFKDRFFFRLDRRKSMEWNKQQVTKIFDQLQSKIMRKIDVIVCGHEQLFSLLDLPEGTDTVLAQYEPHVFNNLICLDCASSTRCYFSYESDEATHPYLKILTPINEL